MNAAGHHGEVPGGAVPEGAEAYREYHFRLEDPGQADALLGLLSTLPFEAFEEIAIPGDAPLKAWIRTNLAGPELDQGLEEIADLIPHTSHWESVPPRNWNAIWEAQVEPIEVSEKTVIRAPFHPPFGNRQTELIIEPRMAFGTGHHATTRLMLRMLEDEDLKGRALMDAGTGSGVLAIYAALQGAEPVMAFDTDAWAVDNARDNCALNGLDAVEIKQGGLELLAGRKAALVLANIQRDVLLEGMNQLAAALEPGGVLLLSGVLLQDLDTMREAAGTAGLQFTHYLSEEPWIAMRCTA
jgi:ribosomal protein L11 methyltransferase